MENVELDIVRQLNDKRPVIVEEDSDYSYQACLFEQLQDESEVASVNLYTIPHGEERDIFTVRAKERSKNLRNEKREDVLVRMVSRAISEAKDRLQRGNYDEGSRYDIWA